MSEPLLTDAFIKRREQQQNRWLIPTRNVFYTEGLNNVFIDQVIRTLKTFLLL